ncbi:hypothetical protein [Desulfovibrio sp. Huiquan2017]|uniref:hypothetical protein n=1 Tax=Desulfovibrio sp. Huiquan2017 TaxID=2816861 RepID=UPI001A934F00|nr:hypothetical protein [Desulfovibrio sp. Huiquan2017]
MGKLTLSMIDVRGRWLANRQKPIEGKSGFPTSAKKVAATLDLSIGSQGSHGHAIPNAKEKKPWRHSPPNG